jgi:hypothetical protein
MQNVQSTEGAKVWSLISFNCRDIRREEVFWYCSLLRVQRFHRTPRPSSSVVYCVCICKTM